MTSSTRDRRTELVDAIAAQAHTDGVTAVVTADPRHAVAPAILVHPVPSVDYLTTGGGTLPTRVWQIVALAPGGAWDLAGVELIEQLQDTIEAALDPLGRLLTARPAAYTTRAEQPAQLALIITLED